MSKDDRTAAVYVQTNEAGANRVIAFRRNEDGGLEQLGAFESGGAGSGVPHLPSQGSVVLTGDGRHLLVTNAASDDVSVLAVAAGGLKPVQTLPSGGHGPDERRRVRRSRLCPQRGRPVARGIPVRRGGAGTAAWLPPRPGRTRRPGAGGLRARRLEGRRHGTGHELHRRLHCPERRDAGGAGGHPVLGPDALRLRLRGRRRPRGHRGIGAQKGKAAASSYVLANGSAAPVSRSVGNGRSEICWAVATKDGRHVFTTNFADGAVSRYAIGRDGGLVLADAAAGMAVDGETGLRDEDLSGDGRFLYAIDADSGRIFGWAVDQGGSLSPIGAWAGVPATVAGLAAS